MTTLFYNFYLTLVKLATQPLGRIAHEYIEEAGTYGAGDYYDDYYGGSLALAEANPEWPLYFIGLLLFLILLLLTYWLIRRRKQKQDAAFNS